MKCSLMVWLAVNLAAAITVCYVFFSVHFHAKPIVQSIPAQVQAAIPEAAKLNSNTVAHQKRLDLREKLSLHKHRVISQLRQSLLQHKVYSRHFTLNQARFFGTKKLKDLTPSKLLCNMKTSLEKSRFKTLTPDSGVFVDQRHLFKDTQVFKNHFSKCAIVSSAGALYNSRLGTFIDSHDFVVRFNNAPTAGFELDVGNKTSLRILNSQILSKPEFQFMNSSLYHNVTLLVWDPCKHNATLDEWARNPDFAFVDTFFARRRSLPEEELHLMDPRGLWDLWDYLSLHSQLSIPANPPSSGFVGLALTLSFCDIVDMIEFVPSLRITERCHYYDSNEDLGCTVGDWHPLAAEKLLVLSLNPNDDETIFDGGYVRISGFSSQQQC